MLRLGCVRWSLVAALTLGGCALTLPSSSQAQVQSPGEKPGKHRPTLFSYGFTGFWNGAVFGLAAGHLATGANYDEGEWKTMVFGAGVGALLGVGSGIGLGLMDESQKRRVGWFVLRNSWYAAVLGALTGAAVGALVMLDSERLRHVANGAAIGGLIGAAAGIPYGIIEGLNQPIAGPEEGASRDGLRLGLAIVPGSGGATLVMPTLRGAL